MTHCQSSQADKTVKHEILFPPPFHPCPSHPTPSPTSSPLLPLSLQFFHISFPSPFSVTKRPPQIQLEDLCIVSPENAFGGSNFRLLSAAEEVKISNVGGIGIPVGT